jgi:hypothetical protein
MADAGLVRPFRQQEIAPITWQGWVIAVVAIGVLLGSRLFFHPQALGLPLWTKPALGAGAVILFLLTAVATSEPES